MSGVADFEIDRDKVRAEARMLDGTGLRVWLDRAIDLLPAEAFGRLLADYIDLGISSSLANELARRSR